MQTMDTAKAEAFALYMSDILNKGLFSLLISIGHQTALFDALARLPPSTSEEIAGVAGLQERYVREWLGGMVVGKVVEYDALHCTYRLPLEHAASLTRAVGTENLAMFLQYVPLLAEVEQQVIDCFRNGGGVPYSAYPRFQRIQAEETSRVFDARLLEDIVPLIPGMRENLLQGREVLDVGCGSGHAINLLAQAFPRSSFTGYDLSQEGIATGRHEAQQKGLRNVRFEVNDVARLDEREQYDLITAFDTIHDQAQPDAVLRCTAKALRQDGFFLMQDIAASSRLEENIEHPLGTTLFTFSLMHCMTVSLASGGAGLGTVWGQQRALHMLTEAGFGAVEIKQVPGDILNNYYITQKRK